MTTIHTILDDLARTATDARDKSDKLGRLMATYLCTYPVYADQYSNVWLWADWPGRDGRPDAGIDLVAQEREGGVCTTQGKLHDLPHTLYRRQARDIPRGYRRNNVRLSDPLPYYRRTV
ncbi:MAG: restriction endonuclease [Acidiferrobacter sp.]